MGESSARDFECYLLKFGPVNCFGRLLCATGQTHLDIKIYWPLRHSPAAGVLFRWATTPSLRRLCDLEHVSVQRRSSCGELGKSGPEGESEGSVESVIISWTVEG